MKVTNGDDMQFGFVQGKGRRGFCRRLDARKAFRWKLGMSLCVWSLRKPLGIVRGLEARNGFVGSRKTLGINQDLKARRYFMSLVPEKAFGDDIGFESLE